MKGRPRKKKKKKVIQIRKKLKRKPSIHITGIVSEGNGKISPRYRKGFEKRVR